MAQQCIPLPAARRSAYPPVHRTPRVPLSAPDQPQKPLQLQQLPPAERETAAVSPTAAVTLPDGFQTVHPPFPARRTSGGTYSPDCVRGT